MNTPDTIRQIHQQHQFALVDTQDFPEFTFDVFSSEYLQRNHMLTGSATGRGTTWFFAHNNKEYVLRHYLRGGLVSKLLRDQFFHSAPEHSRAWQEFNLLLDLRREGLPAPRPCAALTVKSGIVFRSYLITERIKGARDLHQVLTQGPLPADKWHEIGAMIKAFHKNGVYHHDLNIRNIMLDEHDSPWLIDFDKCGFKEGDTWKKENRDRLLRSFRKEKGLEKKLHWDETKFEELLSGYSNS